MKISTFFYTLRQGIINVFRNKWFTLASLATISACLFIFGIAYSLLVNFQHMVKTAEEGVSITGDVSIDGDVNCTKTVTAETDVVGGGVSLKEHTHQFTYSAGPSAGAQGETIAPIPQGE